MAPKSYFKNIGSLMDIGRFTNSPSDVPWVAVFLERMPPGNLHTGIVYRDGKRQLHRLHFGWHHQLIHQQCRQTIACAIPLIDPDDYADEIFIAGFCGRIGRSTANKKIPYSLRIDQDVEFDAQSGAIKIGGNFTGLSCATFVTVAFRSAGNPLVDTSNWPSPAAEDVAYCNWFSELLAASDDPSAQAQAAIVAGEWRSPRARPEHVAGACLEDALPVGHSVCDANGKTIVPIMDGWQQAASENAAANPGKDTGKGESREGNPLT